MKSRNLVLILIWVSLLLTGCSSAIDLETVYFVADYDPVRDPFVDIETAVTEAQQSNRNILLEIGGDWCSWCHILDDFVSENPDIAETIQQNYVVVKINVSEENSNEAFMEHLPYVSGYPHFFILDQQGELLHSQDTALLESGRSYNHDVFMAFLEEWKPAN